MNILWLIPKWTFPVNDGARVATDSLIKNTIKCGANVDVLCLPLKDEIINVKEMKEAWGVKNIHVVRRDISSNRRDKITFYLKKLLLNPLTPLTFSSFSDNRIKEKLDEILKATSYDIIMLDGLHLGVPVLASKLAQWDKVVYRAHNIEADLWKKASLESKNPVKKLFFKFQYLLVASIERKISSKAVGVAAISQEDADVLKRFPVKNLSLIPLGLNFNHPLPASSLSHRSPKFLFIGRLDWAPNRDGLKWLIKDVWPKVIKRRPDVILKIVGSGDKSWLKEFSNLPGIEVSGYVPSIRDAYGDCDFTVVPVFYGSGTRIKVIESFALGRNLISTRMGVQGADLMDGDYFEVETSEEWIELLSTLSLNESHQKNLEKSRLRLAQAFGDVEIGEKFYHWLSKLS